MRREEVARSQRERLFAATVAQVAAKGYEATTVKDLLDLSGVSRSAFYEHFHDKEDCVLATFEALVAMTLERFREELAVEGSPEERARGALQMLFEAIVHQPATARLAFADVYMLGERGRVAVGQAINSFAELAGEAIAAIHDGRDLPTEMVNGILGGVQLIVQARLRRDEVGKLLDCADDLVAWALGYEQPSARLRLAGRRSRPVDNSSPPPFVAYSQAERIIRSLATGAGERGYPAVTIAEISARAAVSQATFYSHFEDKHTALLAALDSAGGQMLGVVMPAARRAPDWPNAIRAAIGAMCGFYAAEPEFARLTAVETYAAGPDALEQRDRDMGAIRALLEPGLRASEDVKPIVADAVLGAVWTLLYTQITRGGPRDLPRIAPLASYMVLAPLIGVDDAVRIANGDGRGA